MVDIRQTIQYANYQKRNGWQVERIAETNYFIKKFPIIGSIIKIQRPEEIRNNVIKKLEKSNRTFQVIIEPKTELDAKYLLSIGYRPSKPFLPSKTLQLDLTLPIHRCISSMKKDARYALRQTNNLQLSTDNINEFRNAWKKAVGWRRYVPSVESLGSLKRSFKNNCLFLVAKHSNDSNRCNINSGAIFLISDNIGYYWQAFTNKEGRRNLAQYKIVWEGIKWAKKGGAKVFDFEGIYDARFPDKSWLGFTHFKKSFGGYEVLYPGCYTKLRIPTL